MHFTQLLQDRFQDALKPLTDSPESFASMIRPTTDPKHGDYQANLAMPLSKKLGKPPRDVAAEVVAAVRLDDVCEAPEIAGPGFINLKVKDSFLADQIRGLLGDARCGVGKTQNSQPIIIDFSSPNVAKPMHVGHIRSTVIGDSLARTLKFLGYQTITDNHLGDWGTQFGIIIYGYKHFGDPDVVAKDPVPELSKLYRRVNGLIEYRKAVARVPEVEQSIDAARSDVADLETQTPDPSDAKAAKKLKKSIASAHRRIESLQSELESLRSKIAGVEADPQSSADATAHPNVDKAVLQETAKLHQGDAENLGLWKQFLPFCKDEINRVYDRLNVQFDHTLGESFYHSMLGGVVSQLAK